ncbi:segment polarity protein dishevelled homolog DVL-1 [Marmota marmota marmota]|uniref:segment polarity protein dishevelled homolog DVL-1 n=1 Tax=Marmota marmota marmota TaxID=9994 RepID=UPI002093CF07|nr:segment polarity protein dishevelled homolog DVL-1 [Marmota marmota marmota]
MAKTGLGVVKEEILDDNAKLPCFNGRVVSWLVLAEGAHSDAGSQGTDCHTDLPPPLERTGGIGDSRPPSFHPNVASSRDGMDNETGTESLVSHRQERARRRNREEAARANGHPRGDRRRDLGLPPDSASTVLSSELESSSFIDSDEEDNTSRWAGACAAVTGWLGRGGGARASLKGLSPLPCALPSRPRPSAHHPASAAPRWPSADPVRPIDPAAWLSHTAALTGALPRYELEEVPLTVKSDMSAVVRVMQLPDSGLEIRDRMWLKITIANAVIGADVVDWLYTHVEGFKERREARKYASGMLKHGFLRHTVNKVTFSEQCYYVFGDLCSNLAALTLNSGSSGASDQDTLAPLPHPAAPWPLGQGYPYQYPGPPPCFPPAYQDPGFGYGSGSAGSQQSEGSKSSGSTRSSRRALGREEERRAAGARGSGSESDHTVLSGSGGTSRRERPVSQLSRGSSPHSQLSAVAPGLPPLHPLTKAYAVVGGPPGGPPVRELAAVPPELTGSRQSFQKAMGNPCEFFVDIM